MHRITRWTMLLTLLTAGCETGLGTMPVPLRTQSTGDARATPAGRPVAYADGVVVTDRQMTTAMYEVSGGVVLGELVLDRQIARKLAEAGLTVDDADLSAERQTMYEMLSPDSSQAVRLLEQLRSRRGLGGQRFKSLLYRNAALRKLIQNDVVVTDSALQQAYVRKYGPLYKVRLIVVDSVSVAADVAHQARQGADFTRLVLAHSTDESRAQGGLIGPISPADPTWPDSIRNAIVHLKPDGISPPVALDRGFAILKLENITERDGPALADVKDVLTVTVRKQIERVLIQRLARTLLDEADVVVLDPALQHAWEARRP